MLACLLALNKIVYDLATQVTESDLPALRSQLLLLLKQYAQGPKPVRVQLCVCLANLAIQMQTWKDVLSTVVTALGNDVASHACILDFLRVLPEEVTEGRKINLSVRGPTCCHPASPPPPQLPTYRVPTSASRLGGPRPRLKCLIIRS